MVGAVSDSAESDDKPVETKPKSPEELYQDMIAASKAYEDKKIYETYLVYQICKRDYENYYADKRKAIKLQWNGGENV